MTAVSHPYYYLPGGVEPVEWAHAERRFLLGVHGKVGLPSTGLSLGARTADGFDVVVTTRALEYDHEHRLDAEWSVENCLRLRGAPARPQPVSLDWSPRFLVVDGHECAGEIGQHDGWWCAYAVASGRVIHVTATRESQVPATLRVRRVTDWTPYSVDLNRPQTGDAISATQITVPEDW